MMSTIEQTTSDGAHTGAGTGDDCDLDAIEHLACSARGIKKRAEVTDASLPQLQEFKKKFDSARTDYATARETAKTDLAAAEETLATVAEHLRCRVTEEQRKRLKTAVRQVFDEIRKCVGGWGCSVGDCDCEFDDGVKESDTVATLAARIAQYREDVDKAAVFFRALADEQTELLARAAKIKADADMLLADTADPAAGKDVVVFWARLLVLRKRAENVWQGFDTVASYMECLCKLLLCVLKGWQTIAILEGAREERICKEESRRAACDRKRDETVAEVMAAYSRLCPPEATTEDDEDGVSEPMKPTEQGC
ncbi:hypothetical protein [Streptomyces sp. IB201691-2A2]|uniref:hypothetical protein n=1 Tax=Streptomyces sp. IB201691-2A2 TaxID=2561920 RepID=UPI001180BC95|nr:hypothetical protein [Streptomyces sp. IB201691-2A2]TRO58519.1 hypothetical protein E4K73_38320 [Streptomyces sp. IB201691-2A2]